MNPEALKAFFEKNKKGLAVAGAGVVVVLALVNKRGKASAPAAAPTGTSSLSAGGAPTSSIPVASNYTGGGTYDSTASDVYGALAPMLERLNNNLTSPIPVTAPPQASKLFDPTYNGQYVRTASGAVLERQGDGSLFGLTPDQWITAQNKPNYALQQLSAGVTVPKWYDGASNLSGKAVDPVSGLPV